MIHEPRFETSGARAHGPNPAMALHQMIDGIKITKLVSVAAKLGIADLLKGGTRSIHELSAAVGAHPDSLYRVLRALAGLGIFREVEGRCFRLTPLAELLQSDVPGSLRAWAIVGGEEWHLQMWSGLDDSVKTGRSAFPQVHGVSPSEYFQQHPEKGAVFEEAMTQLTAQVSGAVLAAYNFSGFQRIVDVGCGDGTLTTALLKAHPHLRSTLFDIPPMVEKARQVLQAAGLADRCDFVAGDFFDSVPPAGDAYVLKNVLDNWDDERAATILKNCRKEMGKNAKVLVVEMLVEPGNALSPAKIFDVTLMVAEGGRERMEAEQKKLFEAAGLRLSRVVPTPSAVSVLEGVPV